MCTSGELAIQGGSTISTKKRKLSLLGQRPISKLSTVASRFLRVNSANYIMETWFVLKSDSEINKIHSGLSVEMKSDGSFSLEDTISPTPSLKFSDSADIK